jgi:hypothetical protein
VIGKLLRRANPTRHESGTGFDPAVALSLGALARLALAQGQLLLKISPAVEPLGKLPSTPRDCCDP